MKATGIVRRIDDLGRVVIPKEIRREMRIKEGDPLEIFVDKNEGLVCFQRYDIEQNYLDELKRLAENISINLYSPENHEQLKIIEMAMQEIKMQLLAIKEREE